MIGRVYKLVCPIKKEAIYVGSTKRVLSDRLKEHLSSRKRGNHVLYDYLYENKIRPEIILLEEIEIQSSKQLRLLELDWAKRLWKEGAPLLNYNKALCESKFSGSLRIDFGIHEKVKDVCAKEGLSLTRFYELGAIERLKKYGVDIPY